MPTMRATFEFEVPEAATIAEVEDWLAFELGSICSLPIKNPLSNTDLEATDILSVTEV